MHSLLAPSLPIEAMVLPSLYLRTREHSNTYVLNIGIQYLFYISLGLFPIMGSYHFYETNLTTYSFSYLFLEL